MSPESSTTRALARKRGSSTLGCDPIAAISIPSQAGRLRIYRRISRSKKAFEDAPRAVGNRGAVQPALMLVAQRQ